MVPAGSASSFDHKYEGEVRTTFQHSRGARDLSDCAVLQYCSAAVLQCCSNKIYPPLTVS